MAELALLSFFITGLLAGTHCAAMCGGIVSAVSLSRAPDAPPPVIHLLAFNAGRIASYAAVGAIVGALVLSLVIAMGFVGVLMQQMVKRKEKDQ